MPNPHFDMKIISRKAGQSAVASASYRSGEVLYDARENRTFDYTRKDDVKHTEIRSPERAPEWVTDRESLWNTVETGEKRKDAQLARDMVAGLPRELTLQQNIDLVRGFVDEQFTARGMIADIAIHEAPAGDGGTNPHVHIMLTMRDVSGDGFGKKNRDWNKRELVSDWREAWETHTNRALEEAGSTERLSLASYAERGIDKDPQKHMGVDAWNMERKGIETEKGTRNREIRHGNGVRDIARSVAPVQVAATAVQAGDLRSVAQQQQVARPSPTAHERSIKEMHRARLQATLQTSTRPPLQAQATMIARIGQYSRVLMDKTAALGRSIFDRFASWTERAESRAPERGRERGHER